MTNEIKKKILVLTSSFPQSLTSCDGGGSFVCQLSKRLSVRFKIEVIAPSLTLKQKPKKILHDLGVKYIRFLPPSKKIYAYFQDGLFSAFRQSLFLLPFIASFIIAQLYRTTLILKKHNIHTIHAHWILPQGLVAVLAKRLAKNSSIKIVVTSHGSDINYFNGTLGNYIKSFVLARIDKYTVVSNDLCNTVKKQHNTYPNIQVIPMGVDTEHFHPNNKTNRILSHYPGKKYLLVYAGRLTEQKGVTYLIDAMPAIINEYPETQLLIIGDGELREPLRQQIKSHDLLKHVDFLGYVPHKKLNMYLASSDICIAPSINEGFGLVIAEAASSGTIVIGTKHPAIQDIIKDDYSGFLIPIASSHSISNKVTYCIRNLSTDKFNQIKINARNHIKENFGWKAICNQYSKVLDPDYS